MAQSPTAQGGKLAAEHPVEGCPGPSRIDIDEETDTDVEIVEEGEEGETPGPVPTAVKGQLDLTPATYRIGRSASLRRNLMSMLNEGFSSLHSVVCAVRQTQRMCRARSPMRLSSFAIFLWRDCGFHVKILWAKSCSDSIHKFIT